MGARERCWRGAGTTPAAPEWVERRRMFEMARSARMRRWMGIVVAAGLVVAVAGCSGDDESGSDGSAPVAGPATTPPPGDEVAAPMAVEGRWFVDGAGRVVQ